MPANFLPDAGASTSPCSETYRGSSAGSELETQILQNVAVTLGPSLITSIHLHTYGQLWLIPWGSYAADGIKCNFADDDAEMVRFRFRLFPENWRWFHHRVDH
jgi:hypothetical protein